MLYGPRARTRRGSRQCRYLLLRDVPSASRLSVQPLSYLPLTGSNHLQQEMREHVLYCRLCKRGIRGPRRALAALMADHQE